MSYKKPIAVLMIIVLAAVLAALTGCSRKPAPKPLDGNSGNLSMERGNMPPRLVIGYYENPWPGTPDQTGSFPSMKTFGGSMTGVGPFWYRAGSEGQLEAKDSQLVYDTARSLGLKMYPLITNKSGATEAILTDPAVRTKVTDNIVRLVQEKNYDGVNIDFELLAPKHREDLTAFMTELYPKMQAINKLVIISVFPQVDVAEDVSGAYDYAALSAQTDFVQVMTYDYHWATSPQPGPIAPIGWYEKNLQYAFDHCGGPQKVIAGIGAYGYDWGQGKEGETITYVDAIARAEEHGAEIKYDEESQAPHFKYKNHEVWFEDAHSISAKLDVVARLKPAGIAIWRLGQEQPDIWPLIDKKFPRQQ